MSAGNFLSALVQRGVQAAGGAMRGHQEGRQRLAAEARQSQEDALQRAVIEARMATEQRQQAAMDREAADFVPHAQRVQEALAEIQARRDADLAVERLRGQNQRATAATPRTTTRGAGGRSDPRVPVLNSRIARLQKDRAADLAQVPRTRLERIRGDTAAIGQAERRAAARADSIGTFERERDQIVGMGGEGAESILGTAKPTAEERWSQLADDPANAALTDEQITEKVNQEIAEGKVAP